MLSVVPLPNDTDYTISRFYDVTGEFVTGMTQQDFVSRSLTSQSGVMASLGYYDVIDIIALVMSPYLYLYFTVTSLTDIMTSQRRDCDVNVNLVISYDITTTALFYCDVT